VSSQLIQALCGTEAAAVDGLLAEDVVFHSPVRTYQGRAEVAKLLFIIGGVVEDLCQTGAAEGDGMTVTLVRGRVGSEPIDGAFVDRRDGEGHIAELTLMLRPLKALLAGVERMGQALAAG
jgi:hypothetical protein